MLGVLVNVSTIIFGSIAGILLKKQIPKGKEEIFIDAVGIFTLSLGIIMVQSEKDVVSVVVSILLGSLLGEIFAIEEKLNKVAESLKNKIRGESRFVEGFVVSSVTFCVGPMAILGSIMDGMGDPSILVTKALLDGLMAIVYSSSLGIGVLFSFIPVFVYQGLIAFFSLYLKAIFSEKIIGDFTATGGLLLLGLGINILNLKKIKVANMLPSLIVVIIVTSIFF
ncbi:MAG: DUF554 domain-containing protein [Thermoproteota archaeon]|nr:DUF554 domain-containing protein [Candidatus Brockarchaeota archaeon]